MPSFCVSNGAPQVDVKESILGSGGGSVGREVASDTRGPRFKSRNWQNVIYQLYNQNTEETKIKKKGREWPIFKIVLAKHHQISEDCLG